MSADLDRVKSHGWRDCGPQLIRYGGEEIRPTMFTKGPCKVLVSHEDHGGRMRWHLSISHPDRYPGWDEIKDARYALLPVGLTFAMILPPMTEYVNIHSNCFHLWEIENG